VRSSSVSFRVLGQPVASGGGNHTELARQEVRQHRRPFDPGRFFIAATKPSGRLGIDHYHIMIRYKEGNCALAGTRAIERERAGCGQVGCLKEVSCGRLHELTPFCSRLSWG